MEVNFQVFLEHANPGITNCPVVLIFVNNTKLDLKTHFHKVNS